MNLIVALAEIKTKEYYYISLNRVIFLTKTNIIAYENTQQARRKSKAR